MREFPFREPEFRSRKIAARASFWLLICASAVFGVMVGLMLMYSINLPQMTDLERYRPSTTTELLDVHGKVFGSFALERRVVVPYTDFPPVLRDAILSIEDKNFMTNGGVNLIRVVGAAWKDLHSKQRSQGASTLTMQLARNLFLSSEKTYGRKLQEIFLTLQIERHFTKPQIFALYANQIYLGRGTYGFEAGANYYFSKHARDLTLPEAALLAGLPKGPEEYSPVRHPERALKRRNLVLSEMYEDHKISLEDYTEAKLAPLGLKIEAPSSTEAPYFVEEVRRQLEREYGVEEAHGAGLRVYTSLDLNLQRVANKAVLDGLATYERRRGWKGRLQNVLASGQELDEYKHPDWQMPITEGAYFHALVTEVTPGRMTVRIGKMDATMTPVDWAWTQQIKATELAKPGDIVYVRVGTGHVTLSTIPDASKLDASTAVEPKPVNPDAPLHVVLEQDSGAQAALMAVNNSNGEVLAMVGGRDFALSQYNRATQAERQVGSSFKPYDYVAAFEAGMKPYDTVLDAPASFYTPNGPYTPHNYESNWRGQMSLVDAFAESRNIPALRLADKVGIKKVIEVARRFGVTSRLPTFLPVAIGSAGITLTEQVASYSVFPNDGIRIAPHYIRRVTQADGLPLDQPKPEVREVISVNIAREMMVLLEAVVQQGTAAAASQMHHAFGGKTGTTNSFTDAWFLGFSPSVTCGTWMGFDDPAQTLGDKETGAKAALPMWMEFMKSAVADVPNEQFSTYNAPKRQLEVPVTPASSAAKTGAAKPGEDEDEDDDAPHAPAVNNRMAPADASPAESPARGAAKPASVTRPRVVPEPKPVLHYQESFAVQPHAGTGR
ncbi:MAG: PBP1A family penicillin-binding protein [Acidobacteriaceae bacterium]|nr:PBP1A family penicillin-binding protein [Acidobacteriaceae bacterium]